MSKLYARFQHDLRLWLMQRARAARVSVVAHRALEPLVALLRLDAERRDRPRLEPADADGLAGLLAIAVGALFDAAQGRVDLGENLPLAVARAQRDRHVGFERGAVGEVGFVQAFGLERLHRDPRLAQDLVAPEQ